MKAAIFSFVKVSDNSMVASVRIARYISEQLKIPIISDDGVAAPWDLLIIVNGAYGFSKHLAALATAVRESSRIVWVQNDYTIIPPKIESQGVSPFRAAFRERHEMKLPHMDFWTTCERWQKFTPQSKYVNWNCLTIDPEADEKVIRARRKKSDQSLLYYGSFRGGGGRSSRERYFDRYFTNPETLTVISSPAKQFREKYTHDRIAHVDAIRENFYETLGRHGLGLYIEDRMSHDEFHSPANRFYEMLSAGLPMVFAPECGTMLRKAGFDPTPYQVEKPRDIKRMMENREDIRRTQWKEWLIGIPYHNDLRTRMRDAFDLQKELLK